MNKLRATKMIYPIVAIALVITIYVLYKKNTGQEKVSEFGKYKGYSQAVYDGTQRISDYLTLSNGTRLAYDLILPTKKGAPANKRLPVLFKYTPYLRTFTIFDKAGNNIIADLFNLGWKERAQLKDSVVADMTPENILGYLWSQYPALIQGRLPHFNPVLPWYVQVWLSLPFVIIFLAAIAGVGTRQAWRSRRWSKGACVLLTLVIALLLIMAVLIW